MPLFGGVLFRGIFMTLIKGSDLSNMEYHSRDELSSSQLKDALEDVERFYKIHIAKTMAKKSMNSDAMDVGTYYHTAILEPEKLAEECAVFTERRAGAAWKAFEQQNAGKVILNLTGYGQAQTLIEATQNHKYAMTLINGCEAELSCFASIMGIPLRVRADGINTKGGYILDLKTMTGNAKDESTIIKAIRDRNYDMSAALYLDVFNMVLKKGSKVQDFFWVFASKDYANCRVYRMTQELYDLGRSKYMKALNDINEAKKKGWKFEDEGYSDINPAKFELNNYGIEPEGDAELK